MACVIYLLLSRRETTRNGSKRHGFPSRHQGVIGDRLRLRLRNPVIRMRRWHGEQHTVSRGEAARLSVRRDLAGQLAARPNPVQGPRGGRGGRPGAFHRDPAVRFRNEHLRPERLVRRGQPGHQECRRYGDRPCGGGGGLLPGHRDSAGPALPGQGSLAASRPLDRRAPGRSWLSGRHRWHNARLGPRGVHAGWVAYLDRPADRGRPVRYRREGRRAGQFRRPAGPAGHPLRDGYGSAIAGQLPWRLRGRSGNRRLQPVGRDGARGPPANPLPITSITGS